MWRVLLDSGSDGDLLFVQKGLKENVPFKERFRPQKWRTSNGTFRTTKVGNLDMIFPEFSESKVMHLTPDIVDIPEKEAKPAYDLILGTETLAKLGVILDFESKTITIDQCKLNMVSNTSFTDQKSINAQFKEHLEPASTREATKRAIGILDAVYEKANLPEVIHEECSHLTLLQQSKLLGLLKRYETLFDGTLGDWQTNPVKFNLQLGAKPYHGRAFPIPHIHKETLKKEVTRLVNLGVLKKQPSSEWASPTFIIPKSNQTVRFISDFREVNKRIIRTPFPIPKIKDLLTEMEGFTYATALDLNMGYYTIRLDPDAQKICTIILPWGKYSYMRLPMGIAGSPDIFQERMSGLMENLEYVRTYIDDLLILSRGTFDDHLLKLQEVLDRLLKANLRVNATKSSFAKDEVEYLGYILTREGIKPQPAKIQAILALSPPESVKDLRKFLGMVQYYRDLWEKRSHLLAPLTDLVGECGQTKTTRQNKTKKTKWHWDESHQKAYDGILQVLARDVTLAYPDFNEEFEIYTDASQRQLGAVITQRGRPLAYFSRKLSLAQRKYSVTELELLSIVETLKEFKGMLWGQRIKVWTDHKNLIREACGLSSDRVYRWRVLLEEYGPVIEYIKGVDNVVADALSRLDYDEMKNIKNLNSHQRHAIHAKLASRYMVNHGGESNSLASDENSNGLVRETFMNNVFANADDEDEIYPVTVSEIATNQRLDKTLKTFFTKEDPKGRITCKVIDDVDILIYDNKRMCVPASLTDRVVQWYHHYLQHPGHTRLEETLKSVMYWHSMRTQIRKYTSKCVRCQKGKKTTRKYGSVPAKIAETVPWKSVCVDLIGPYTLKGQDGTIIDFMCLTMIDPATGWFEIIELPDRCITVNRKGKKIVDVVIDKSSAQVSKLFNKQWLSRYPRAKNCIYDNGSEFKLHFKALCESYQIKRKPTTVKNPQANAVLERIHGVIANMMRTAGLDLSETVSSEQVDDFLVAAAWAVRSTHHTVLNSTPGAAIFGRDMLFDIPYIADWTKIGQRRQLLVDQNNARENLRRIDFDYTVGNKVLLKKDGILRKAEDKNVGPYVITQVHTNGTVRIQRGNISERLNIRRLIPFKE